MRLPRIRTFESLGLRDYRLLWLGQLTTSMGQWMDQVSRTWLIYDLTRSPLQLGLVSAVRGIPLLAFGALAGVVADRYERKKQLVVAQSVNALLNAVLGLLILTGQLQIWHVYVTGFLAGTVQAFQQPARQVLISDLVGDGTLLNAVSLNSAALNLSRSVGPAVSGLLIEAFGVDISYFFQAIIYAVATVWTIQITVPVHAPLQPRGSASGSESLLSSAREGVSYIASHKLVLALIVLGLAPVALGMPFVSLMAVFATDVFGGGAAEQGILLTMQGAGAVLGALAIATLGRRQGNGRLLMGGALGFGLALVLFARSPVVYLAAGFVFLAGLFNSSYTSQNQTIIQMMVPRALRGRVLGIYLLNRGLMPLGALFAGALASLIGAPWAVTVMGGSCFVLAAVIGAIVPGMWRRDLAAEGQRTP